MYRQTKRPNSRHLPFDFSLLQLRDMKQHERFRRTSHNWRNTFFSSRFPLTRSFTTRVKSLKVAHSDPAIRTRFHNRNDTFKAPSSTPQTPSSWPSRPDLTGLGPSCVSDHVITVFVQDVIRTRCYVSWLLSWRPSERLRCVGDPRER